MEKACPDIATKLWRSRANIELLVGQSLEWKLRLAMSSFVSVLCNGT
ncbi:hypothetical protein [Scytonema sp. NUACC21]